jgi:hypothetical protein
MAANGSGLQLASIRNIATAWVLTLPAAMLISATDIEALRAALLDAFDRQRQVDIAARASAEAVTPTRVFTMLPTGQG